MKNGKDLDLRASGGCVCRRLTLVSWLPVLAAVLFASTTSAGAAYPDRPIKLVVVAAPGGPLDIAARILQEPLRKELGQPIVIENKNGASGAIASTFVAKSAPDGYTLLLTHNAAAVILPLTIDTGYDLKDFAPITQIGFVPLVLVANPSVPVSNLQDLVNFGRSRPQGLNFASAGALTHLITELFARAANIKAVNVGYKGQSQATMAVVSGEVQFGFNPASHFLNSSVKDGKLKALGVTTGTPSPLAPDVAPISKTLPMVETGIWIGLVAPAATPPDVVARLQAAVTKVLGEPDVKTKYLRASIDIRTNKPDALKAQLESESAVWAKIVRDTRFTMK